MYSILLSSTFVKQFKELRKNTQDRIRRVLLELEKDPFDNRPKVDIKSLKGTKPLKHRLRVGDYRIIYHIDKKEVRVIEVFKRSRGYR